MARKIVQNFSLTPLAQFHSLGAHTEQIIIQMRTKALLLAAAFAAAGVATSMAQVYSVNAVGYVNVTLKPGYNLVSNPLNAANNSIGTLFANMQGGVIGGTTVYKFANGNFIAAQWDDLDNKYTPDAAAAELVVPGDGVFVLIPGGADKVLTFVGEVVQGDTTTAVPRGYSIKASVVPQAGKPDAFGLQAIAAGGDTLYRYDPATKQYAAYQFDDLDNKFSPDLPIINVGEAFFYLRVGAAATWARHFDVNNPT